MEYKTKKHSKMIPCAIMLSVLVILVALVNALNLGFPPIIGHTIVLVYTVFVCWYFLRFVATRYIYRLDEENITFVKYQSKRETEILKIAVSDIMFIGRRKNKKGRREFPVIFANNLTADFFPQNSYIVVYRDGEYMRKLKIEAAKEILMELKRRIPDVVRIGYLNKGEPIDGNY